MLFLCVNRLLKSCVKEHLSKSLDKEDAKCILKDTKEAFKWLKTLIK